MSRWQTSSSAYGAFYAQDGWGRVPARKAVDNPQSTLLVELAAPAAAPAPSEAPVLLPPGCARVVRQPGDGSCCFHSLAHSVGADPGELRLAVADFIEAQADTEISGTPLRLWIEWDSGLSPTAYAQRMRTPGLWGGAIELAVFTRMQHVPVHVYEPDAAVSGAFRRISTFAPDGGGSGCPAVHLLYRGRVHYDALEVQG